jgi:hypothetical protein
MPVDWASAFRQLLADIVGRAGPSHGYSLAAVEQAETRLGVKLPGPLRDYYLSVGRHKLNQVHNRLLPPARMYIAQRRLVFMEENQWVVYWGVRSRSRAADPVVFQTTDPSDDSWAAESPCSQFLSAMLCWQAVCGGLPHIGYCERIKAAAARPLLKRWPFVGRMSELSAFARSGQVACLLIDGKSALVQIGTRSRRDFQALVSELGVAVRED